MERTAKGVLESNAVILHPLAGLLRLADRDARELLVCLSTGHAQQNGEVLLLRIALCQNLGRRLVKAPHVSGVTAVSAPELLRCAFQHQNGCTVFGRAERRAEG